MKALMQSVKHAVQKRVLQPVQRFLSKGLQPVQRFFRKRQQRAKPWLAAGGLTLYATASHAAVDISTVTSGISDAQTAILSVLGALVGLSVAIFGIGKVYAFLKKKAGA